MNTIHRDRSNGILRGLSALAVVTTLGVLQGCQIFGVASVIGQNIEREEEEVREGTFVSFPTCSYHLGWQ